MTGTEDFYELELVVEGQFFVDKSAMIVELLHKGGKVTLVTRPRFGKTLALSMIYRFFVCETDKHGVVLPECEKVNPILFKGGTIVTIYDETRTLSPLEISTYPHIMKRQGRYPVIYLSLKDVCGKTYDEIESGLRRKINDIYTSYEYLKSSQNLSESQKIRFDMYLKPDMNIVDLRLSLKVLTQFLFQHFNKKVYILIDEYDAPINDAYFQFGQLEERREGV